VTLSEKSSLSTVALTVGEALSRNEIRGVLTGGACVSLYTRGAYHSEDVDFVLSGTVTRPELDAAMESVGFVRRGDRYVHELTPYYVEFPPGPLAIGTDLDIHPIAFRRSRLQTLALSATDCCRDRLAGYYHWSDRQSLRAAVLVAISNATRMSVIERWSAAEGASSGFEEFKRELQRSRTKRARRKPTSRTSD
jgi:hypothetical protein